MHFGWNYGPTSSESINFFENSPNQYTQLQISLKSNFTAPCYTCLRAPFFAADALSKLALGGRPLFQDAEDDPNLLCDAFSWAERDLRMRKSGKTEAKTPETIEKDGRSMDGMDEKEHVEFDSSIVFIRKPGWKRLRLRTEWSDDDDGEAEDASMDGGRWGDEEERWFCEEIEFESDYDSERTISFDINSHPNGPPTQEPSPQPHISPIPVVIVSDDDDEDMEDLSSHPDFDAIVKHIAIVADELHERIEEVMANERLCVLVLSVNAILERNFSS